MVHWFEKRNTLSANIVIIDYGMGNLRSVQKAFEKVGFSATITRDHTLIKEAHTSFYLVLEPLVMR